MMTIRLVDNGFMVNSPADDGGFVEYVEIAPTAEVIGLRIAHRTSLGQVRSVEHTLDLGGWDA